MLLMAPRMEQVDYHRLERERVEEFLITSSSESIQIFFYEPSITEQAFRVWFMERKNFTHTHTQLTKKGLYQSRGLRKRGIPPASTTPPKLR